MVAAQHLIAVFSVLEEEIEGHPPHAVIDQCGEIWRGPVEFRLKLPDGLRGQLHPALAGPAPLQAPDIVRFKREPVEVRKDWRFVKRACAKVAMRLAQSPDIEGELAERLRPGVHVDRSENDDLRGGPGRK